jgi:hypothetical protein
MLCSDYLCSVLPYEIDFGWALLSPLFLYFKNITCLTLTLVPGNIDCCSFLYLCLSNGMF